MTPESARRALEFRIDSATNQRLDILAAKANEARLTPQEQAEYEASIDAMDHLALLRIRARKLLNPEPRR